MKKAVILLLILLVVGIVGFFVYNELSVKEIVYVSDTQNDMKDGRYSVKRLYSSDVDVEAFNEKVEDLILLEFSEEDIEAAALSAGVPELYPAFHFLTYRPFGKKDTIYMDLRAVQELAPGQSNTDYCMENVRLEVMTTGISITEAEAVGTDSMSRVINEAILRNEEGTELMTDLNDYGEVTLNFEGNTGTVTLQYTFDIRKNTILPAKALTGCLIMVRVNIITNARGETEITYQLEPYSTIDEYNDQ